MLKMVWNEKTLWLRVWGYTVVREREIIYQDLKADAEQNSKLRVRSQITPRSIRNWKGPMRGVCWCRLPAHFHGLDGQSGSARGKGHSKHDPPPPSCPTKPTNSPESQERSMQNPLQIEWDVSQWLSRFSLARPWKRWRWGLGVCDLPWPIFPRTPCTVHQDSSLACGICWSWPREGRGQCLTPGLTVLYSVHD